MLEHKEKSWLQTWSGKQFHPFNISQDEICIADIAHALSHLCRYTGHVNQFYSVAQHCCYVSDYAPEQFKLWALLHDATEAYIADINSPTKHYLEDYKALEHNLMSIIALKYGLNGTDVPDEVKRLDMAILNNEREQLMTNYGYDWDIPDMKLDGLVIEYWQPFEAESQYLTRFLRLC